MGIINDKQSNELKSDLDKVKEYDIEATDIIWNLLNHLKRVYDKESSAFFTKYLATLLASIIAGLTSDKNTVSMILSLISNLNDIDWNEVRNV